MYKKIQMIRSMYTVPKDAERHWDVNLILFIDVFDDLIARRTILFFA